MKYIKKVNPVEDFKLIKYTLFFWLAHKPMVKNKFCSSKDEFQYLILLFLLLIVVLFWNKWIEVRLILRVIKIKEWKC